MAQAVPILQGIIPTREQLFEFVRAHAGEMMWTAVEGRPFQLVGVKGDRLELVTSTGESRLAARDRIESFLSQMARRPSIHTTNYKEIGGFNNSYLIALVLAWQQGHIERPANAVDRTALDTLTAMQREALIEQASKALFHRASAKPGESVHCLALVSRQRKGDAVGAVYWAANDIGNEVEIALNLAVLAQSERERQSMRSWLDAAFQRLQARPARNHGGRKEGSWSRMGFPYDVAMQFFDELRPNLDPMFWGLRWRVESSPAKPVVSVPVVEEPEAPVPEAVEPTLTDPTPPATPPDAMDGPGGLAATIEMMRRHAQGASDQSGQERTTVRKTKVYQFADDAAFEAHLAELFELQGRRCNISGLELQLLGQYTDLELLASLDRIDSDGHYEPGNLQVVCRFVNRWKGDDDDGEFRRLIGLVRAAESS